VLPGLTSAPTRINRVERSVSGWNLLLHNPFLPASARRLQSAILLCQLCPSVRPSVQCLYYVCLSEWTCLHNVLAVWQWQHSSFSRPTGYRRYKNPRQTRSARALNIPEMGKLCKYCPLFPKRYELSPYTYYGTLIGSHRWSIDPFQVTLKGGAWRVKLSWMISAITHQPFDLERPNSTR